MKLTREELTVIRDLEQTGNITRTHVRTLLDFARDMLLLRDALLRIYAAVGVDQYNAANTAFWKLARELAETDAKT